MHSGESTGGRAICDGERKLESKPMRRVRIFASVISIPEKVVTNRYN
ncbi:hypothetical protein [Microcoleus sp. FACHB-672]|nr:hypothetical protein [Microcoleus sp. FACHB-672]MBD2040761.1 hypothetical protein [Microcoleus sp. FACHB-672]